MKIKSIKLSNIQSWDADSPELKLSSDAVNVLIAPSETGKSVLIKVLKEMCFPNNWGYNRLGLIRRGAPYGVAYFILEDDTIIGYVMQPKGQVYTILRRGEDGKFTEKRFNNAVEIPEEIADLMGLIVDREAKTVINVLDKNMPMPLINTSPKLSGRIVATVTENPQLELIKSNLKSWDDVLTPLIQKLKTTYEVRGRVYREAPEKDESKIVNHLTLSKKYMQLFDYLSPINFTLMDISTLKQPQVKPDLGLTGIMESMKTIKEIIDLHDVMIKLQENHSIEMSEDIIHYFATLGKVQKIKKLLDILGNMKAPKEKPNLECLADVFKSMQTVRTILKTENELLALKKPHEINALGDLDSMQKSLMDLMGIIQSLQECEKYSSTANTLAGKEQKALDQIKQFEEENKICPLCGSEFKGEE
jgi:hypothetical protein